MDRPTTSPAPTTGRSAVSGDLIVRLDVAGTVVFVVTSVTAAAVFTTTFQWVGAITAMVLFTIGVAAFLWSFYNGVQRSRAEQVAVTQLYLLAGGVAPSPIRRLMSSLLAVQVVTGLATALARPDAADGTPGSSLALGVLVPVFGLGLNGWWAAFHGTFEPRTDDEAVVGRRGVRSPTPPIDKNDDHG